jgi:glycosyl transferase family 25
MKRIDKVLVLHVKNGYEERKVHMNKELAKFNIDFEYLLDYDIEDLNEDELKRFYSENVDLDGPNLSVGMKHIEVLNKIVSKNYKLTLVFEDDVFLSDDFVEVLDKVLDEVEQKEGFVISLGNAGNFYVNHREIKNGKYLYENTRHRAADSYIIDNLAAKRRLEWFKDNKTVETAGHMYNTIDKAVGNTIYWSHPTVVEQGSQNGFLDSSIQKKKFMHRLRWLWRDFNKKYLHKIKVWK